MSTINVGFFLVSLSMLFSACNRDISEKSGLPISVDTAHLRMQIDSIGIYADRNDTLRCKRALRAFHNVDLAVQQPLLVYNAYFAATNLAGGAGNEQCTGCEGYLAALYGELQQLANIAHSERLQTYSEYLPARRQSNLGDNARALPKFLYQLERFIKLKDRYGEGLLRRRIGLIYFFVYRHYEKATTYFREALLISPDEDEKIANAEMLVKASFCMDNADSLYKYRQMLRGFKTWTDEVRSVEIHACYYVLGYMHGKLEQRDSADEYVYKMLDYYTAAQNTQFNDVLSFAPAYSISLTNNQRLDEAGRLIARLKALMNGQQRLPNNSLAVYDAAIHYHEACGDTSTAFRYLKARFQLSQKLRLEENREQAELARIEYEAEKQQSAQQQVTVFARHEARTFKYTSLALIVTTLTLLMLGVLIVRQSRLRRRLEGEQLRSRLSRDLHDDIGSTLSSINILSRTAQRNLSASDDEKTKASLEKMSERSQRLLDSMSDIIWNIQTGNDTLEELLSRMREYATGILEAKGIACTFDAPAQAQIKLGIDTKTNLYLIFKEAVNNLAKYSGCSEARMSLVLENSHIVMEVSDNGQGFNQAALQHEGGLRNMQHRAAEMKGSLSVTSDSDNGTRILLHAPLR